MRREFIAAALLMTLAAAAAADPIGDLHCNDAQGVAQKKGQPVAIAGVVTGQFSSERNVRLYVQDATGAVNVYGSPKNCAALGDSVRVSGVVGWYRGLTEIVGTADAPLVITVVGRAARAPAPQAVTAKMIRDLGASGCEADESRLVELSGVVIRAADGSALPDTARFADNTNYRLVPAGADSAATVSMRVGEPEGCDHANGLEGQPVPHGVVRVTGVVSQFLPQSATQGGYQLLPRVRDDVRAAAGR